MAAARPLARHMFGCNLRACAAGLQVHSRGTRQPYACMRSGRSLPRSFGNLTSLRQLQLSNNRFTGSIPASWDSVASSNVTAPQFGTGSFLYVVSDSSRSTSPASTSAATS